MRFVLCVLFLWSICTVGLIHRIEINAAKTCQSTVEDCKFCVSGCVNVKCSASCVGEPIVEKSNVSPNSKHTEASSADELGKVLHTQMTSQKKHRSSNTKGKNPFKFKILQTHHMVIINITKCSMVGHLCHVFFLRCVRMAASNNLLLHTCKESLPGFGVPFNFKAK